jgi:ArsR family metal-binding transcriptional regulator
LLIQRYEIRVESPPCHPGSECWSAFAQLSEDISAVLPYLNTRLKGAIYNHSAQVLTWQMGSRAVSIRPHEVAVSELEDRTEADAVIQGLVDLVNHTWEERNSIRPSLVQREPLKALEVYRLLPRQNCKACGEPTCFTFALKLASGQAQISQCPPLFTADYESSRERLLGMLAAAGIEPVPSAEA